MCFVETLVLAGVAPSPPPNGFPSPPRECFPKQDERFALRGPPMGARVKVSPPQSNRTGTGKSKVGNWNMDNLFYKAPRMSGCFQCLDAGAHIGVFVNRFLFDNSAAEAQSARRLKMNLEKALTH
jgi:hypothetical protein